MAHHTYWLVDDTEKRLTTDRQKTGQNATVAAAMAGDRDALAALWQEHRRWIAAVILAYKPREADLEDLLQEVAMTLLAKIKMVREESNVKAWLRVVAVNAARAAGRSQRSRPVRVSDGLEVQEIEGGENAVEVNDHSRRVLNVAAELPEAYREPLMLKAVQGMRTRQIAEILDLPEATVDTRISRGRRMLREMIDGGDTAVARTRRGARPPVADFAVPRLGDHGLALEFRT